MKFQPATCNLQKIPARFDLYMHDVAHDSVHLNLKNLFRSSNQVHSYNTRFSSAGNYYVNSSRTTVAHKGKTQLNIELDTQRFFVIQNNFTRCTTTFRDTKQCYATQNSFTQCTTMFHVTEQFYTVHNNLSRSKTSFRDAVDTYNRTAFHDAQGVCQTRAFVVPIKAFKYLRYYNQMVPSTIF